MTGFSAPWLRLREPYDLAARARAATGAEARAALDRCRARRGGHVLDLGCGTGANLRALAPSLGHDQRWTLVDHDPALLDAMLDALARWAQGAGLRYMPNDGNAFMLAGPDFSLRATRLRRDLVAEFDALPLDGAALVTGSALLDLVSSDWLEALVHRSAQAGAALWFALNVDGRIAFTPEGPEDAEVVAAFERHQRRDKGFGPALAHEAIGRFFAAARAAGMASRAWPTDWRIGLDADEPGDAARLVAALVDGMANAALEQRTAEAEDPAARERAAARIGRWRAQRTALADRTGLVIGHRDLFASR